MQMLELLEQKIQLTRIKRSLDNEASFDTWEGKTYAHILAKLALIELELEEIEKTTRQCGLK